MDVRSFKLRLEARHLPVVIADARGARGLDFEGEAFARVREAARPLTSRLEQSAGTPVRALSVDSVRGILRASLDSPHAPGLRLDGPAYRDLAPLILATARAVVAELRPAGEPPSMSPSRPEFWSAIYQRRGDGWELGRAAPPLARHFARHPPRDRRALVVGCGRGHEARLLAGAGARVTAIDFVASAIDDARAIADREGLATIDFQVRDLFEFHPDERFNLILEHCCFCAIERGRRDAYVDAVADLLYDDGELVGLFWAHGRPGGPPFSVSRDELLRRFERRFACTSIDVPDDSVATRIGEELLATFRPNANLSAATAR